LSITVRGAFPGRYPGILANRAKLFAIVSHSFATSSGGNSICSFETEPGCFSTSTFIGKPRYAVRFCRATAPAADSAGDAPTIQLDNAFALHVNRMRLRNAKPVRQLAVIFAIENREVGKFVSFQRADLIAAIEAVSSVDCRCRDRF
jgi:hypothetical protein